MSHLFSQIINSVLPLNWSFHRHWENSVNSLVSLAQEQTTASVVGLDGSNLI